MSYKEERMEWNYTYDAQGNITSIEIEVDGELVGRIHPTNLIDAYNQLANEGYVHLNGKYVQR